MTESEPSAPLPPRIPWLGTAVVAPWVRQAPQDIALVAVGDIPAGTELRVVTHVQAALGRRAAELEQRARHAELDRARWERANVASRLLANRYYARALQAEEERDQARAQLAKVRDAVKWVDKRLAQVSRFLGGGIAVTAPEIDGIRASLRSRAALDPVGATEDEGGV